MVDVGYTVSESKGKLGANFLLWKFAEGAKDSSGIYKFETFPLFWLLGGGYGGVTAKARGMLGNTIALMDENEDLSLFAKQSLERASNGAFVTNVCCIQFSETSCF